MKERIQDFLHQLLIYDYLLFGGVIVVFLLLLVLAIVFRHRIGIALLFVLLAFSALIGGPIGGYIALHNYLFKNRIIVHEVKALEFTEALLIRGDINNTSKRAFKECTIQAGVYKVSHNKLFDTVYPLIPFKKGSLVLSEPIEPGKSAPFKLFVEPFRYTKEFNITIKAQCK